MTSNGDSPFDLEGFRLFRQACMSQYMAQHPRHDILRDQPPTIVEALDAAIDEIERLRALEARSHPGNIVGDDFPEIDPDDPGLGVG